MKRLFIVLFLTWGCFSQDASKLEELVNLLQNFVIDEHSAPGENAGGKGEELPAEKQNKLPNELQTLLDKLPKSPSGELLTKIAIVSIKTENEGRALTECCDFLKSRLETDGGLPQNPKDQELLQKTSEIIWLLMLADFQKKQLAADMEFSQWLCASAHRSVLLDNINYDLKNKIRFKDNPSKLLVILRQLYHHDDKMREECWPLMVAMALVWDVMPRPPLHHQMGPNSLKYTMELEARYDFYRSLLTSNKAPYKLSDLTVQALSIIVDTPVPVSELLWAQKNIHQRNADTLYRSIVYDKGRLANTALLVWSYGPYSLEAIKKRGGICVDQAYYTVIGLRAQGIPAFLFSGKGKRGPHAWVAYMHKRNRWKTDVGRYEYDDYTTGTSISPQTSELFNDHLLSFVCDRLKADFKGKHEAAVLVRLACLLRTLENQKAAKQTATKAIAIENTNLLAWDLLLDSTTDEQELLKYLGMQEKAFSNYPDVIADIVISQSDILRKRGMTKEADKMLRRRPKGAQDREDLELKMIQKQAQEAINANDPKKARILYERYLKKHLNEEAKLQPVVDEYLALTKRIKQTKDAVRFLSKFTQSLRNRMNDTDNPALLEWQERVMAQAYVNNGETEKAKRLLNR